MSLVTGLFLPGTSLEPAVIPTAQASSFTLQYFPYYVSCSKCSYFCSESIELLLLLLLLASSSTFLTSQEQLVLKTVTVSPT